MRTLRQIAAVRCGPPTLVRPPFWRVKKVGMGISGGFLPNSHGRVQDSWRWPPAAAEGAVLVQNRMENHSAATGSKIFFNRMLEILILRRFYVLDLWILMPHC